MAANDIKNKTASIYIDDQPAIDAYNRLIPKAEAYNKKIEEGTKKAEFLQKAIQKSLDAGGKPEALQKKLAAVNTELDNNKKALEKVTTQQKAFQQQIDAKTGPSLKQQQALVTKLVNEYKNLGSNTEAAANKLKEIEAASKSLETLKNRLSAVQVAQKESRGFGLSDVFTKVLEFSGAYAIIQKGFDLVHNFMEGTIEEADQAQEAVDNLAVSLANAGRSDLLQPLLDQADKFAEKYKALDNDDITGIFTKLVDYGKLTQNQMVQTTDIIINYARKQRISLGEATDVITKALEGSAKGLKIYGINLTDAKTVTERYNIIADQLGKKVAGAEDAFENTGKGIREKFSQKIRDAQEAVGKFIYSLAGLEDRQYKIGLQAKEEADTAQQLVNRYEELSKKTNQTAADKAELQRITSSLASTFGTSVVEIDKETGALKLNVQATKDLITQKLLLASDAAATEANRYRAALNAQKDAQDETAKSAEILKQKQKEYGETAEEAGKKVTFGGGLTPGSGSIQDARTKTEKELGKLQTAYFDASKKVDDATKQINESAERLKKLGFSTNDLDKLLNPTGTVNPNAIVGSGDPNESKKASDDAARKREEERKRILEDQKKLQEELLKLQHEYEGLVESEYIKELQSAFDKYEKLKELAHGNKEDLQKIEVGFNEAIAAINKKFAQKELEELKKQDAEKQKLREKQLQDQLKKGFDFVNQVGADVTKEAGNSNALRKATEDLEIFRSHGKKKYQLQKQQLEEEKQAAIEAAKQKGEDVEAVIKYYQQKEEELEKNHFKEQVDMYHGFAEQLLSVWQNFIDKKSNRETAELNRQLKQNDREKQAYQRMLANKMISQQQYLAKVNQLDIDSDKKKEALEKKQFERNKKKQIVQAVINGLQAELKTLAEFGPPIPPNIEGIIASAFTIGATVAEIAAIKKQEYTGGSSSAKYAKGGIPDGPSHKDGGIDMINSRTGRKVGEMEGGEPYMILSGKTYKNNKPVVDALLYSSLHRDGATIDPWFKNRSYKAIDFSGISRSIQNVRHYASGGTFQSASGNQQAANVEPIVVPAMTEQQEALMQALLLRLSQPFKGYVVYQDIKDAGDTIDSIKADTTFGKK